MNISVPFVKDFPYNDEVQEFDIVYNSLTDDYLDLLKFLEANPNIRINIELINIKTDVELLHVISKTHSYVYFKLSEWHVDIVPAMQEKGLKYYFSLFAYNWDILNSLLNAGVTDIYLADEIGFKLVLVQQLLHEKNIRSRAIVNLAMSADPLGTLPEIKSFFIRPEDLSLYSLWIDTFEFSYPKENRFGVMKVLYESYIKDKFWYGDLSEIIVGLNEPIDSRTLLPTFAVNRLNCGKRCYRGGECHLCEKILLLSQTATDKGLSFFSIDPLG